MKIYLVGGAVRDQLLGLPVKERDWVVVGAAPNDMLAQGFRAVGKDFPVFLHPETHEEYALARTERKTGKGYTGFDCYAAPDVTLEQDLQRRDLTINAMAKTPDGEIIDPYGGQQDLKKRRFRHVSPAFVEDPVRILRIARFAARFSGFHVHPDTLALMQTMVENGEVNALVSERVWKELERALSESAPQRFFEVLTECHAANVLFPNINSLQGLINATLLSSEPAIRFAALLCHNTEKEITHLCERLRAPRDFKALAILAAQHHTTLEQLNQLSPDAQLTLLEQTDALRRPERFYAFLLACEANNPAADKKSIAKHAQAILRATREVSAKKFVEQGLTGQDMANALRNARLQAIRNA